MPAMPATKSPAYLRLQWLGPALLSVAQAGLSGVYGDGAAARLWSAIAIGCLAMAAVVGRVRYEVGARATLYCLAAACWLASLALPFGAATAVMFVAAAMSIYAIEPRLRGAGPWLLFVGGVPAAALLLGWLLPVSRAASPVAASLLTLVISSAASAWQLGASRQRLGRSLTRLKALREQMLQEVASGQPRLMHS